MKGKVCISNLNDPEDRAEFLGHLLYHKYSQGASLIVVPHGKIDERRYFYFFTLEGIHNNAMEFVGIESRNQWKSYRIYFEAE